MTKNSLRALALAGLTVGAISMTPREAHAEKVAPTAKGIVGGGFLGAELVVFGEAIFGVRSVPAYLVGAGIGAAGGAVGGYFIEQAVDDGRIPAYLLAGGLALVIPAIVVTLDQTRYLPTEGARDDKPVNAPPSDPGKPGGSSVVGAEPGAATPAPATPPATDGAAPAAPPATPPAATPAPSGGGTQAPTQAPRTSLIDLQGGSMYLGVPVPEVRPIMAATERQRMGVDNRGSELRFPVLRVAF